MRLLRGDFCPASEGYPDLLGGLPVSPCTVTKSQSEIFRGSRARMYGAQRRPVGRYGSARPFRS